ncbi:MAG: patatin-like phospholipase family protein [Cyclobacteriaceae bacterium]
MKKKVSLVLSGGGARGIAHIGVIEELQKQGFEIEAVAGTSMGALIGGVFALGKMKEFKEWLYTLDRLKTFNLVDFTLSTQGLVKGEKVLQKMKDFIPDANIEDLPVYYRAIAADIKNSEEVVFSKGSVYQAIRASMAIPTVFTPVKMDNRILIDGGVLNNLPINHAKRTPDNILVAVNVNANKPVVRPTTADEEKSNQKIYLKKMSEFYQHLKKINPLSGSDSKDLGYFDLINKTINLMTNQMAQLLMNYYTIDMQINISRDSCGTFDFYRAKEQVEIGQYEANESITEYIEKLEDNE